jgi:hypothetical protein
MGAERVEARCSDPNFYDLARIMLGNGTSEDVITSVMDDTSRKLSFSFA